MLEQSCRGGGIRTHDSPLAAVTDDPRPKVGQILTIDGALPTELRLYNCTDLAPTLGYRVSVS